MECNRSMSVVLLIVIICICSIIVNILFAVRVIKVNEDENGLSWSRKAAAEAEAVAAISCSGHGRAYLDGIFLRGTNKPICECNPCYDGPNCSHFLTNCAADADNGEVYFLEPYWMQNSESSAILLAGWHRMGYSFIIDNSYISQKLENQIRKLHEMVGNAITTGRYIIFGAGSTQLLNAAVHVLALQNKTLSPARVLASIPFYPLYKDQTEFFDSKSYNFNGDSTLWKSNSNGINNTNLIIEIVTSPNNPDGRMNKAVFNGSNAKAIYDRVYYWPHYTAIQDPADDDIMLFSLSKFTGHAGTRFGWALIKDRAILDKMNEYLSMNTEGVSRDAQLRALKLIDVVLQRRKGHDIFEFAYETLSDRWEKLNQTLSVSKRFSLQNERTEDQYCRFFKKVRKPSPGYAWMKCEREVDKDCHAVLKAANISARTGSLFSADSHFVRLALIRTQDDFDLLLKRLQNLVSQEK